MKVHELNISTSKDKKRVGRGIGSGYGKTAGRGTKGQNARTGGGVRPGFEGGQNPLAKRLPKKRGFASLNRLNYQVINLSQLSVLKDGGKFTTADLVAAGLAKQSSKPVKILGDGEVTKKLTLHVQGTSVSARAAIIKAGGSIEITPLPSKRPIKKEA